MNQLDRIRAVVERVATSEGLEVVDVELHGRGRGTVVRVFLDKPYLAAEAPADTFVPEAPSLTTLPPAGVSLEECRRVSQQVGMILDVEEIMRESYTLEVSSPGLDRKLVRQSDYQRFAGQRVAMEIGADVPLDSVPGGARRFRGKLLGLSDGRVQVELDNGGRLSLSLAEIDRANLVPEFPKKEKPGKGPGRHRPR